MNLDRFKLRIWDKEKECSVYDVTYDIDAEQFFAKHLIKYGGEDIVCLDSTSDRYIIQQCTGLKDSEGRLIYEGDIVSVKDSEGKIVGEYVIRWLDDEGTYCYESSTQEGGEPWDSFYPQQLTIVAREC